MLTKIPEANYSQVIGVTGPSSREESKGHRSRDNLAVNRYEKFRILLFYCLGPFGCPISFFSINDVVINRKKLSKFLGEQENKYEYRSYTIEEISSLHSLCDERGKAIVLLMASTGMRVGAFPWLKLKHLKRHDLEDGKYVYRIKVYATSKKARYFTFCTPECANAIDNYLSYRKRLDRSLVQDMNTKNWGPDETYIFTKLFDIDESSFPSNNELYKQPMSALGIRAYIVKKLKKLNLRKEWTLTENSSV